MRVKRPTILAALILAGAGCVAQAQPRGHWWLELVGTTDRHGHVEPAPLLGGYLAIERREHPGKLLLLDGGDLFTGTLTAALGEGSAVIHAMNALGYDASAVGNHDFDFGPVGPDAVARSAREDPRGALKARAGEARFPLLTCNIVDAHGRTPPFARPFVIREVNGARVAIVGGTTEATPETTIRPNLRGLTVLPLAPALAAATRKARAEGADVVVAVVHAGGACPPRSGPLTRAQPGDTRGCSDAELFHLARALAQRPAAERPDAIFGGHTHHALTAVVGGIPLSQADPYGAAFSVIALELDGHRPTGAFRVEPPTELHPGARYHGQEVAPDPKVAQAIAPDLERVRARRAESVGVTLAGKLWRAYDAESPMGNLFADLIRAATSADIGLVNGGGLRADLPAGPLRYGALFEALPFANRLTTLKLTGAALTRLFAANLGGDHGLLSIGGARVEARCADHRLAVTITLDNGHVVGSNDTVRVGLSDFLALGGDDFGRILRPGSAAVDESGPTQRDVIAAALRRLASVRPDDPRLFDPAHPRWRLPGPRPIVCR